MLVILRTYSVGTVFCLSLSVFLCNTPSVRLVTVRARKQESLALASMERDDLPASSTVSSTVAAMRSKVGSEFET